MAHIGGFMRSHYICCHWVCARAVSARRTPWSLPSPLCETQHKTQLLASVYRTFLLAKLFYFVTRKGPSTHVIIIAGTKELFEGHTPPQPRKNCIRLLGGSSLIERRRWRGAQCLMWGVRGAFPPASAVVGHGCDGRCCPVTSDYFNSYAALIHS
jgi:hypothetical protein